MTSTCSDSTTTKNWYTCTKAYTKSMSILMRCYNITKCIVGNPRPVSHVLTDRWSTQQSYFVLMNI